MSTKARTPKKGLRGRKTKSTSKDEAAKASPPPPRKTPRKKSFRMEYLLGLVALIVGLFVGTIKKHWFNGPTGASVLPAEKPDENAALPKTTTEESSISTESLSVPSQAQWVPLGSTLVGPQNRSQFGFAVQLVDNSSPLQLLVGIPGFNDDTGAFQAYSYDQTSKDWVPQASMLKGKEKRNEFGRAFSFSTGRLVVGSMVLVRSYKYSNNDEQDWKLETSLEGESRSDGFGFQVGLGPGDTFVVAAPGVGGHQGVVDTISNGQSIQSIRGQQSKDQSGASLAVSKDGSTLAIGSPMFSASNQIRVGQVRIYKWSHDAEQWIPKGSPLQGGMAEDWLGQAISLSADGSIIAVGSPGKDTANQGQDYGAVQVYKFDLDNSEWVVRGGEIEGKAKGDQFGFSVSLSEDGNTLAASAVWNDDVASRAGHVCVYRFIGQEWQKLGQDMQGEKGGDWFGNSVSLSSSGNAVAVGAICRNNGWQGYVKVFQMA